MGDTSYGEGEPFTEARSGDRPDPTERSSDVTGLGARAVPAFAIFASLGYFFSMGFNFAPFVYYPEGGEFYIRERADALGPPMFWYGWIVYGALAGAIGAALFCLLPRSVGQALVGRWSWLVWGVPTLVIAATLYFLRSYF